jgi:hypothetical protein
MPPDREESTTASAPFLALSGSGVRLRSRLMMLFHQRRGRDLTLVFRANNSWRTARLGVMQLLELERRQGVQAAVWSDGVEVKAPGFDDDLGRGARAEPLDAQAFVAELAVEALVVGVLPGLAGSIKAVPMPICASTRELPD